MIKWNYKKQWMLAGLFLLLSIGGCSDSTDAPVLEDNPFFSFELNAGDLLIYQGPNHGLTIEGPDTVNWNWIDGDLFMGNELATVRVRPLIAWPHEEMSEGTILQFRSIFISVPFIDEWLEGIEEPTNEEWAEAFEAWMEAQSTFAYALKVQYRDDEREDRLLVVSEIAEQANNHELIVPGSVRFSPLEDNGTGSFDLYMVSRGWPTHENGTPDESILLLRMDFQEPSPLPTEISEHDALILHSGVHMLFEASAGPLLIDLSNGYRISTLGD